MVASTIPLREKARLAEALLSRSLSSAEPKELAKTYQDAVEALIEDRFTPQGKLLGNVQACLSTSLALNGNPHDKDGTLSARMRALAYQTLLQHFVKGDSFSLPASLASVVLQTVDKLPEVVSRPEALMRLQSELLDGANETLRKCADGSGAFLIDLGKTLMLKREEHADFGTIELKRIAMMKDTLAIIASTG